MAYYPVLSGQDKCNHKVPPKREAGGSVSGSRDLRNGHEPRNEDDL